MIIGIAAEHPSGLRDGELGVDVAETRSPVGELLRDWRQRRRLSQLDLTILD